MFFWWVCEPRRTQIIILLDDNILIGPFMIVFLLSSPESNLQWQKTVWWMQALAAWMARKSKAGVEKLSFPYLLRFFKDGAFLEKAQKSLPQKRSRLSILYLYCLLSLHFPITNQFYASVGELRPPFGSMVMAQRFPAWATALQFAEGHFHSFIHQAEFQSDLHLRLPKLGQSNSSQVIQINSPLQNFLCKKTLIPEEVYRSIFPACPDFSHLWSWNKSEIPPAPTYPLRFFFGTKSSFTWFQVIR